VFRTVLNFVLFYGGWFACVLGMAKGLPWLGPLAAVVVVGVHVAVNHEQRLRELCTLLTALLLGPLIDTALAGTRWFEFKEPLLLGFYAPVSLIALWAVFSTTLHTSLGWLTGRPAMLAVGCAIAGPLTYLAAAKMGAAEFVDFWPAMLVLGVLWAGGMPVIMHVAQRVHTAFGGARAGA
jgi:hypothetical protein